MLLLLLGVLMGNPAVALPDPSLGNVNGLAGRLFWPASLPEKKGEEIRPLATADGCEVFLVTLPDEEKELRYPCGKWFVPPAAGVYDAWMEKEGQISPARFSINYRPVAFEGRGFPAMAPLIPAGRVAFAQTLGKGEEWRVFSAENTPYRMFYRRSSSATMMQMPVGKVVVARFDRKTNDAVALSPPVQATAQRTVTATPRAPAASDVLVILTHPGHVPSTTGKAVAMELRDDERVRPADIVANAADRIVAIWYGVDARTATLTLRSEVATWRAADVRLVPGKVATVRGQLAPLPKVTAVINAPRNVPDLQLVVERNDEALKTAEATIGANTLANLPSEPLRVTLKIGDWQLHRDVDLSSGDDAEVAFDLEPLQIRGTVYHGDDAVEAELAFRNDKEWVSVRTDDRGRYEATLWWPQVHLVRVTLPHRNVPPFLEGFREILGSGVVDFHVPRTDYRVRVRDAATGAAIVNARVTAGNTWLDEEQREHNSAEHVLTDGDGIAVLPPLQKGELILEVRADRYATSDPMRVAIDDAHHELDVALAPIRTVRSLRLLLPGGAAAANGEVWAVDDAMQLLWRGTTSSDGAIELPQLDANAIVVARHPSAAASVHRANAIGDVWTLAPRAEPLTIVTDKPAQVALWIDGVRLFGPPLAFATASLPATNARGVWTGDNLPASPLQLVAIDHAAMPSLLAGAFDAVASTIPYPRPARVAARILR